jgi:hypothetical protein
MQLQASEGNVSDRHIVTKDFLTPIATVHQMVDRALAYWILSWRGIDQGSLLPALCQ